MCEICRRIPCVSSCPNAPEPHAIYRCKCCKEPITAGEPFYTFAGHCYHEECFEDSAVDILLDSGAEKGIAESWEADCDD